MHKINLIAALMLAAAPLAANAADGTITFNGKVTDKTCTISTPASKIDEVLAEVARYGVANVRRAYGNWKSPRLKGWEAVLHEYAIRPIQQFAYSKGKNASDMAMVIDAMDLLYARNLDGFAIVSSDADFTPMVMRLLTDGVKVYGFGEKKTPEPFVNACSKFTYLEALGQTHASVPGAQTPLLPCRS